MTIVMCCTRNWYFYVAVELYALFKHNKVKRVYLFIEDDNIPYIIDKRVEFINYNNIPEYITKESPNYNTQYSKLSYLRCYFSKILKEDKILYVDADAIVVDNIEELWNIELEDNVLAGIYEPGEWNRHLWTYGLDNTYINSGVLLMDLKKIREEHLDDSMIYLLNHNKYAFPDQDTINLVCRNRIKHISNIYNSTETTGIVNDAKIIHYIRGRKGWIKTSPRSEIWYNYHDEYIKKEGIMNNYRVKATKKFNDYEGKDITNPDNSFVSRNIGDVFNCTGERYLYLKEHNAVELVEILPNKEAITIIETKEAKDIAVSFYSDDEKKKTTKKKASKK